MIRIVPVIVVLMISLAVPKTAQAASWGWIANLAPVADDIYGKVKQFFKGKDKEAEGKAALEKELQELYKKALAGITRDAALIAHWRGIVGRMQALDRAMVTWEYSANRTSSSYISFFSEELEPEHVSTLISELKKVKTSLQKAEGDAKITWGEGYPNIMTAIDMMLRDAQRLEKRVKQLRVTEEAGRNASGKAISQEAADSRIGEWLDQPGSVGFVGFDDIPFAAARTSMLSLDPELKGVIDGNTTRRDAASRLAERALDDLEDLRDQAGLFYNYWDAFLDSLAADLKAAHSIYSAGIGDVAGELKFDNGESPPTLSGILGDLHAALNTAGD